MDLSELFPSLPEILFAERDPETVESEIITQYENLSGRTLAKGDPIRLFLEAVALIIIQQRYLIDYTGKQNLLAYSEGNNLDHLGALLGVSRLEAECASVKLKFTLTGTLSENLIIPAGTRAADVSGLVYFALDDDLKILAGNLTGEGSATCTEAGIIGNDFLTGQINILVDPVSYVKSVININTSSGGSDAEDDENFRERIQMAPESFSVAGPEGAYEYYARSANSYIRDVTVIGPPDTQPGHVDIYVLMENGELPSDEILNQVYETCNDASIRPDTDYIQVLKPETVKYNIRLTYYIDRKKANQAENICEGVNNAIENFILWQRQKIGRDINPSELTRRILEVGAKRVNITQPAFKELSGNELAVLNTKNIIYGGLESE